MTTAATPLWHVTLFGSLQTIDRARPFLRESLLLSHETGHRLGMVEALEEIAASEAAHQRRENAAHLWGMAAALRENPAPLPVSVNHGKKQETVRACVQEVLGDKAREAGWVKGRALVFAASPSDVVAAACRCLDCTNAAENAEK